LKIFSYNKKCVYVIYKYLSQNNLEKIIKKQKNIVNCSSNDNFKKYLAI